MRALKTFQRLMDGSRSDVCTFMMLRGEPLTCRLCSPSMRTINTENERILSGEQKDEMTKDRIIVFRGWGLCRSFCATLSDFYLREKLFPPKGCCATLDIKQWQLLRLPQIMQLGSFNWVVAMEAVRPGLKSHFLFRPFPSQPSSTIITQAEPLKRGQLAASNANNPIIIMNYFVLSLHA